MRKPLLLGLALVTLGAVASCGSNKPATNPVNENYVLINDFETLNDVILNKYDGYFGKVGLNDNTKFITSSQHSLLMMPKGDPVEINEKPKVKFNVNESIKDIRPYSHLAFDMFNDSDEEVQFVLKLNFGGQRGSILGTMDYIYKLPSKQWVNIYHRLNVDVLSLIYNVENLKSIEFSFDFYKESPKIYLDNLAFRKSDKEYKEIEIELDEDEICSFDKSYQSYSFMANGYGPVEGIIPTVSMNNNPAYSREGKSLKMVGPKGTKKENSWPYISLSPKILPKIDFSKYGDGAMICLDIFNNTESTIFITVDFHETGDINYKTGHDLEPMVWNEIKIPLKDLNKNSAPDHLLTDHLNYMNICYPEFADKEFIELYIDSIRIEK